MRVDEVHDDAKAHAMRGVDERLEVVGSAEARGRSEEGAHVVAEGAVIGMLHDRHELDDVVAGLLDAWKHLVAELRIKPFKTLILSASYFCSVIFFPFLF